MYYKHKIGKALRLHFFIAENGIGIAGESPVVAVRKQSDGEWLDDAKTAFQVGYNDIAMVELDATNHPGAYYLDITHLEASDETYDVQYKNAGTYAGDDFESHEFTNSVLSSVQSDYVDVAISSRASGGLAGARTITIQLYETATTTPIADAAVSIYNSDQSLFMGALVTDSNGQVVVGRDDGTYKLVFQKAGVTYTVPETMVVTADDTKTYYGSPVAVGVPSDPDVCRVYDYLFLPDGVTKPTTVIASATITQLPHDMDGKLHAGTNITEVYDANTGLIYWDIVWGATVGFDVEDFIEASKVIPELSTARLVDIT